MHCNYLGCRVCNSTVSIAIHDNADAVIQQLLQRIPKVRQQILPVKQARKQAKCFVLLEFPSIGRKEKMDGLIAQVVSALQVFINDAPNGRGSFRKLEKLHRLAQSITQVIKQLGALCAFATTIATFNGNEQAASSVTSLRNHVRIFRG